MKGYEELKTKKERLEVSMVEKKNPGNPSTIKYMAELFNEVKTTLGYIKKSNNSMSLKKSHKKHASRSIGMLFVKFVRDMLLKRELSHKGGDFNYGMTLQYAANNESYLNLLCDKYGTDKGETKKDGHPYTWPSHTYADVYELLFQLRRHDVTKIIECGLGTNNPNLKSSMGMHGKPGASLRVWKEYFQNAEIVGIDIDEDILFDEYRIRTYYCDQTSPESIKGFIYNSNITTNSVDIIIDDGLHEYSAGICLFENLIGCLALDGLYVIEDVTGFDYLKYKDYFSDKSKNYRARFVNLHRPGLSVGDNRLIVIGRNAY